MQPKASGGMSLSSKSQTAASGGWDDNDFMPEDSGMASASQYDWGGNEGEDDFFSSVVTPKKVRFLFMTLS